MDELADLENIPKHKLYMTVLMTPDMANFTGKVHGGSILKLLDQVAYACASRFSGNYVVTLSVDQVNFRKPVQVGALVNFFASVNYVGNTSMEIGIKVIANNIISKERYHANSCFFTMVAVDKNGTPVTIPKLELATDEEKRRFKEAKIRKASRLELAKRKN